jgi:hypothetical protein
MVFIHATGVRFSYGLPDYERYDTINKRSRVVFYSYHNFSNVNTLVRGSIYQRLFKSAMDYIMNQRTKQKHKETAMTVGTGLVINYPLNLFFLWLFISVMGITDPFTLSILITAVMTVLAYIRVYLVRSYYDK